ncbi:HPP family protein [Rutstroemia sp. NJR-2017a BVV2]|nr:HPP family protein [Rutstroemia sp. NJR-2017a BVV2]
MTYCTIKVHSSFSLISLAMVIPSGRLALDFNIDDYLNRFIPASRLHILPQYVSWFLGYRREQRAPVGTLVIWFWAFVGAFCGIAIVEGVYSTHFFKEHGTPLVIASFGAAAVLEYNTIDSPLAQPRNAILGQILASIIGVSITKLFELSSNFENLRWLAGALSVGVTSAVMGLTGTIHPPAGATALMAATSVEITEIGWRLIPVVALGSILIVATACVINNIQRTFPVYWWTAVNLRPSEQNKDDIEKAPENGDSSEKSRKKDNSKMDEDVISIGRNNIVVPAWMELEYEERAILEVLRNRLNERLQNSKTVESDRTRIHGWSDEG